MHRFRIASLTALAFALLVSSTFAIEYLTGIEWQEPPIIKPGNASTAPSDAVVLFGGKDLSKWTNGENWPVKDGVASSGKGLITTKDEFGDCQLHLEWASPSEVKGESQGRGNSGVFMMGKYELQILDSFDNKTYYDGQASAIYKQTPPMANAMRPPGEWNTYDVLWTGPRFNDDGSLKSPAYITVLHNGVVTLNHYELLGDTPYHRPPQYIKHGDKGPISLQDHGNPVRFRNIWVREMKPPQGKQAREPFLREDDGKEIPIPKGPTDARIERGKATLTVNINVDGNPLNEGTISFSSDKSDKVIETKVKDGKARIEKISPGEYRVGIRAAGSTVSEKHGSPKMSGLSINAAEGDNEIDFELRSE